MNSSRNLKEVKNERIKECTHFLRGQYTLYFRSSMQVCLCKEYIQISFLDYIDASAG